MRLHEAVALGRNIRRINDKFWISPDEYKRYAICLEDAIDDLWEVEPLPEKKIEITQDVILQAFVKLLWMPESCEILCKELGFDDE